MKVIATVQLCHVIVYSSSLLFLCLLKVRFITLAFSLYVHWYVCYDLLYNDFASCAFLYCRSNLNQVDILYQSTNTTCTFISALDPDGLFCLEIIFILFIRNKWMVNLTNAENLRTSNTFCNFSGMSDKTQLLWQYTCFPAQQTLSVKGSKFYSFRLPLLEGNKHWVDICLPLKRIDESCWFHGLRCGLPVMKNTTEKQNCRSQRNKP